MKGLKGFHRMILVLEIKPGGLVPRIWDVEAFWYKTEIKIIYFEPCYLIVCDFMVYSDPKFLIFKNTIQSDTIKKIKHNGTK